MIRSHKQRFKGWGAIGGLLVMAGILTLLWLWLFSEMKFTK